MKDNKLGLLCAAVLAVCVAAPAAARCIDEENPDQQVESNRMAYAGDAAAPRAALKDMVKEALRRSQSIGASKLLAEAAESDWKEAKAGHWPVVSATGFLGGNKQSGQDVEDSSGKQGRVGVNVTAPLFDGGRTTQLADWRKNLAEAARFGQLSSQEQVALQTVSLAMERSRYRLQVQVYQQFSRKMSCLVEALETIVRADKGRTSELIQARKTLQQAEISQAQTVSTVRQIEIRLRRFVGDGLPPIDGLSSLLLQLPDLSEFLVQAENASEISQLTSQAAAAKSFAQSVDSQKKPQVNFSFGGNRTAGSGSGTSLAVGVNVNIPLFNPATGHASDAAAKRAAAAQLQREDALENRKSRMTDVYEQASSSFDRARRTMEVLRDSDRVRNFTLQQWQQLGRRSLFDVMSAENEHYNLRVAYVNALYDGQQSAALLWSLGIGLQAQLQ